MCRLNGRTLCSWARCSGVEVSQQLLVLLLDLPVQFLLVGHKGFQAVRNALHGVVVWAHLLSGPCCPFAGD